MAYSKQFRVEVGTILYRLMLAYIALLKLHRTQYGLNGTKREITNRPVGKKDPTRWVSGTETERSREA